MREKQSNDEILAQEQEQANQRIAGIISRTGLSASEIARRAGLSPSTLTRHYPVPSVQYTMSARTLAKLSIAFPLDKNGSPGETGQRAEARGTKDGPGLPVFTLRAGDPKRATSVDLKLELYSGDFRAPISLRQLPHGATDLGRYFVCYMPGDSMEPRIRAGDALLIDRLRPPPLHADVMVQYRQDGDSVDVCIGVLVDRDQTSIEIMLLRDGLRARIDRNSLNNIYLISGVFDASLFS